MPNVEHIAPAIAPTVAPTIVHQGTLLESGKTNNFVK